MSLQEDINTAWKEALKARDPKKDVLTLVRNELKNKAISERSGGSQSTTLSDESAVAVLRKMAKQRKESIATFESGGRDDLVAKEKAELLVIEAYLPSMMSEEAVAKIVEATKDRVGASSMRDMGKLMGALMGELKGKADGSVIQRLVKESLQ